MSDISVFVKARPVPNGSGVCVERRCRCGMCFDATGRTVSVTTADLARLKADPLLVVTDADAATAAATDAPQAETPDAPATETDKTAAKADKKAG